MNGKRQFDMILTDVIMPHMDGLQASFEIRKIEEAAMLPPVPIVALTANAMSQDRIKCAEAGMSFLSKPFVRDDLYRMMDIAFHVGVSSSTDTTSITPPGAGEPLMAMAAPSATAVAAPSHAQPISMPLRLPASPLPASRSLASPSSVS